MSFPRLIALALAFAASAFASSPVEITWDYADARALPEAWNSLQVEVDGGTTTPDGQRALRVQAEYAGEKLRWPPFLVFNTDASRLAGVNAVEISFWARADATARLSLRVTNESSRHFSATRSFNLGDRWKKITFRENLTAPMDGKLSSVPRLLLAQYRPESAVYLGPVSVCLIPGSEFPEPPVPPTPPPGWAVLDTSALYIRPGSALDYTPFSERLPAGALGRVVVNERGEMVRADRPDEPLRFLSYQWIPRFPPGFRLWSDAAVSEFADAIARQGYNMVRLHFLDDYLSGNNRAAALRSGAPDDFSLATTPEEIHWDEAALDRVRYFLAELKKRGVYWNLDLMTTYVGHGNDRFITSGGLSVSSGSNFNTKAQFYANPVFRKNWRAGALRLLTEVNPHTGLALKDDPALALVSCLNEQEILVPHRDYGTALDPAWHAYLIDKYETYGALYAAWGGRAGDRTLPAQGEIARDVPSIDATALTDTPAGRDMARAIGAIESEATEFYLGFFEEIGFTGLASNWNMRTRIASVPARSLLPVVTMNQYHAHPRPGRPVRVSQASALAVGGNSFKGQALARFVDRPFINTEFGHIFWNPYRHEQGVLHGAGAALQGWSGITRHAQQVVDVGESISHYNAGYDPVSRAAETVAAFLFRRGDVSPSPHTVEIPLDDDFIYGGGRALSALDDELSRLWPLVRVGVSYGEKRVASSPVLIVPPDRTSDIGGSNMFSTVESSSSTARLETIVGALRERGVLAAGNRTAPSAGVYESDTGQVLLDTSAGGEFHVRSHRHEAAVLKRDQRLVLDALTIESVSVPAAVSLISIDPDSRATLRDANRLLLVFSTDARNSGMVFTSATEEAATGLGDLPVIVRTGRLSLTLQRTDHAGDFKAYALRLDGSRAEEVPLERTSDGIALHLDTSRLPAAGPTPFFELVRQTP